MRISMSDPFAPTLLQPAIGLRAGNRLLSVMDQIREAILGGSIGAGERLNGGRLSKTLAVSRAPRAAALNAILDGHDIRASLEGVAARFAAERGLSPEENAVIQRSLLAGDRLLERGSFEAGDLTLYRDINGDFHDTLLAAARNRMLAEMIRICHHVPVSSSRNIVAFEHRDVRRRHDDHHRIYEAIIAGETWRAEMLMREHVSSVKGSLLRAMAARNREQADQ